MIVVKQVTDTIRESIKMMSNDLDYIKHCRDKVLAGDSITKSEAMRLVSSDLEALSSAADEIRRFYNGDDFDLCSVLSIKGGRCSENCRFCPQSSVSITDIPTFSLLDTDAVIDDASASWRKGVKHYCMVASGKRLADGDVDRICESIKEIRKNTGLKVCASMGLLGEAQLRKLKEAGVSRIHNNLETSPDYFTELCTSHSFDDKLTVARTAKAIGLELCCGGIFGTGESWEDRIDMALIIRELEPDSLPVNLLNPVQGTPLGHLNPLSEAEVRRIVALYKFIVPHAFIRLAAGRDFLDDTGLRCFAAGSNAAITGDCLTVKGIGTEQDIEQIKGIGFKI